MKKTTWAGIIGALLVIVYLIGGVYNIVEPSKFYLVNIATLVSSLLWVLFGVFLVGVYVKNKKSEETESGENLKPDLWTRRNRIFAYVLVVEILGSVSVFILNDYSVGLTVINIATIFDVAASIVFAYFAIQLFKNKDVIKPLFYSMIVYGLGGALIWALNGSWPAVIIQIIFCSYFLYAISVSQNNHTHRVAHVIVLPMILVLTIALIQFENKELNKLLRDDAQLEQEYANASDDLGWYYSEFREKDVVTPTDIKNVEDVLVIKNDKNLELVSLLGKIKFEYSKKQRSGDLLESLDQIDHTIAILELHRQQVEKVKELMEYYKKINPKSILASEQAHIDAVVKEIDSYDLRVRDLSVEFDFQ